jgi:hypothetical protein
VNLSRPFKSGGLSKELGHVMFNDPTRWQAMDVLTDGAVGRVAVQRSGFRQVLSSGGVPALKPAPENKVSSLSGGVLE